jgi:hypothetical protein
MDKMIDFYPGHPVILSENLCCLDPRPSAFYQRHPRPISSHLARLRVAVRFYNSRVADNVRF